MASRRARMATGLRAIFATVPQSARRRNVVGPRRCRGAPKPRRIPMSAKAATAGRRGWIISDGKRGNEVQSGGVLAALGLACETKLVEPKGAMAAAVAVGSRQPGGAFRRAAKANSGRLGRILPLPPAARRRPTSARSNAQRASPPTPSSCRDPKVSVTAADLFWVPEHDARRGANVVTTLTAPHGFSQQCLIELAQASAAGARRAAATTHRRSARRTQRRLSLHRRGHGAPCERAHLAHRLGCGPHDHAIAADTGRGGRAHPGGGDGAIPMALGRGRREPLPLFLGARGCLHRARRSRSTWPESRAPPAGPFSCSTPKAARPSSSAFIARSSGMERRGRCPAASSASRPGATLRSIRPRALPRKWRAAGASAPKCWAAWPGGRPEKAAAGAGWMAGAAIDGWRISPDMQPAPIIPLPLPGGSRRT